MAKDEQPIDDMQAYEEAQLVEAENIVDALTIRQQAGFDAPMVPLKDMLERTFIITFMTEFSSFLAGGEPAFRCICYDQETKEQFRTVISCHAGVETLQAAYKNGIRGGIRMRFRFVKGGRYKGYYELY